MRKILCATRGGEASYRTQDAVIERALEEDATILFLYVVDLEFLKHTSHGTRPHIVRQEMDRMGNFLLAMACERAANKGVTAHPILEHGKFDQALIQAAQEEKVTLIAFGRPAEESVFQMSGLQELAQRIELETGVKTEIF
ncbi:MAG: universal stress protein [Anaerolineales bacterium]|nr:universal stress protein [Anaerolineales bacterium]